MKGCNVEKTLFKNEMISVNAVIQCCGLCERLHKTRRLSECIRDVFFCFFQMEI